MTTAPTLPNGDIALAHTNFTCKYTTNISADVCTYLRIPDLEDEPSAAGSAKPPWFLESFCMTLKGPKKRRH